MFDNLSLCENLSVSRETRQAYKDAADEFAAWVAAKRLKVHPVDALDDAMTAYIDPLFLQGKEPHQAKYALFGVVKSGMVKSEDSLPRARQAIAGFSGQSPSVMREPIPVEAVALMAEHLVDVADLDPMAGLAACAMVLSFDLYLRPSEVIELTKEAVVPPQGTQYPKWKWAVIVAPSGPRTASSTTRCSGMPHARRWAPTPSGTKNGARWVRASIITVSMSRWS